MDIAQSARMAEALAIIPARGGSKGIPHKNVRLVAGKPLLAHTILSAQQARTIGRIVVSTDDSEIAAVASACGAEVIWRPAAISGDTASSEAAVLHVLEQLHATEGVLPDVTVFLQCTAPLMNAEDIDGTVAALEHTAADTALAVTPFYYFLWHTDASGDAVGINHEKTIRLPRQQLAPQYQETGAVYVMRTAGFLAARHRFFGRTAMYVTPPERDLEIDDPVDLQVAEVLLRERHRQEQVALLPDPVHLVVLDFDGVLTDNRVWVDQDGRESVVCSRGDGMGLSQVSALGIEVVVLSKERNPVVAARCTKLQVSYEQGVDAKAPVLQALAAHRNISLDHVIYVGNDRHDLECLQLVGCGVVVADAHPDVYSAARLILSQPGGAGAVRELCDLLVRQRNRKDMPDA